MFDPVPYWQRVESWIYSAHGVIDYQHRWEVAKQVLSLEEMRIIGFRALRRQGIHYGG